jgi:phospholipase/carboxylesterase
MSLVHRERPAAGEPAGLLILHHGRGADEHDLLGLADALDPRGLLYVITPRAPLTLPGWPGYHWYSVPRVGHPDPATFESARRQLAAFHDDTWRRTGIGPERTVLGGFSMGAVMSYATGLSGERPVPAGILALSGFVPQVAGWEPDLASRAKLPVLIAHGRRDPVIDVSFGRRAHELLGSAGLPVTYLESGVAHQIDPAHIRPAAEWLAGAVPGGLSGAGAPAAPTPGS